MLEPRALGFFLFIDLFVLHILLILLHPTYPFINYLLFKGIIFCQNSVRGENLARSIYWYGHINLCKYVEEKKRQLFSSVDCEAHQPIVFFSPNDQGMLPFLWAPLRQEGKIQDLQFKILKSWNLEFGFSDFAL